MHVVLNLIHCIFITHGVAGDYDNAIDYLVSVGGIAKEKDYEYLGQDNFCDSPFMADTKKPSSSLVRVKVRPPPLFSLQGILLFVLHLCLQ